MGLKVVKQSSEIREGLSFKEVLSVISKSKQLGVVIEEIGTIENGPYSLTKFSELEKRVNEAQQLVDETKGSFVFTFEMKRI